jgi:phosphatidylglycerophosphatase A
MSIFEGKENAMNRSEIERKVWTDPRYFIGYGLGTGLLPKMPGTWGTLLAIPVYLVMARFNWEAYLIILLLITIYAVSVSDSLSKEIGLHDDPGMNVDEIVGYLVTMLIAPNTWAAIILGFVYFRVFDIWKPWPIRWVDDKVKGGFGMILDDLLAGIAAMLLLNLSFWLVSLI